jgi:uracil-DNA glycosylase
VLLLNTSLTVQDGQAGSHSRLGWQALADAIVQSLCESDQPLVFMLWGAHAQACWPQQIPTVGPRAPHLVLRSNHPSPLSAVRGPVPYIGNGHFGLANRWLNSIGNPAVHWLLPDR